MESSAESRLEAKRTKRRELRQQRLGRFYQDVSVLFLAVVVLLAALSLIAKDRAFSDAENRTLAQRPTLTLAGLADGSFFSGYSSYLADQFFGRDAWISLDTLGTRLTLNHQVNGIYIGRDGYLFSDPDQPDEERLADKLEAVNAFAKRHDDINIMFLVAPGSSSILTEKLPAHAPIRNQIPDIQDIQRQLDSRIQVLDVSNALLEHRGEEIYYRTDHHWTSLGAYYAYTSAVGRLSQGMSQPSFSVLTVADDFEGTLASQSGVHRAKDSIDVYLPQTDTAYYVYYPDSQTRVTSLFVSSALEEKDKYTVFFGGNHPVVEIHTTVDNGHNLLVFKDSYANSFIQFLTTYYDNIILVDPRYYYDSLSTLLTANGITDVLFLYSGDTFMTDGTLTDVLATG